MFFTYIKTQLLSVVISMNVWKYDQLLVGSLNNKEKRLAEE
jgi:hypothetical protein